MKLWAKLALNGEENTNHLIRSFFEEFHPESSIFIKGKQVEIEVVFEEPPMRTVDAIVHCDIIEFNYGNTVNECSKEKICIPPDQIKEEKELANTDNNQIEEKTEIITDEVNTSEVVKLPKQREKDEEILEIPGLTEIATKSSSYEDFVKSVLEWLKFGSKQEMFEKIIKVAEKLDTISWKNIKNELANNRIDFAKNEEITIAGKFKTRFKECKESITPMPFIKAIIAYKTFNFDSSKSIAIKENDSSKSIEVAKNNEPISEITCLNDIFISVDKNQPIEEKVTYILKSMGLNRLEGDIQEMICKIANAAVKLEEENLHMESIMAEFSGSPDNFLNCRIAFSKFINDFVKENNCDQKIKLIDFLEQLRKMVIVKE